MSDAPPLSAPKTCAEALALCDVGAEEKFENGGPADSGPTIRRHLHVTHIGLIGKEADKLGDAGEEDGESEAVAEFGPGANGCCRAES